MKRNHNPTIDLCQQLVQRPSVTPNDHGCQKLLSEHLSVLGFNIENMRFKDVDNLWARYGTEGPLFVFAGHTDVVPTGPEEKWSLPPYGAVIKDGKMYGRGTADMKGSIAAFITALERFFAKQPTIVGSVALLITSDEEGPALNGTVKVIDTLEQRSEKIDWCLVGEPTSSKKLGDVIKNGRRGSLNARLNIHGIQRHIAYPHHAGNPIHRAMPALDELCVTEWDQGNAFFPATSFQISNINAGTGATNVTPGIVDILFNFRFSTEVTSTKLQNRVENIMDKHNLDYKIEWTLSGNPFLTEPAELINAAEKAISKIGGYSTTLSTSGGTSDGRFIAPTGAQVIELGPLNSSIHQIDENISCTDLDKLSTIYETILQELLT